MDVIGSFITYEAGHEYLNIMMKYYDESLYSRIKSIGNGKMNNFEAKIIIYQIFKGLSYIHSLNICHRDIKP
jgi:serine/threonine protein kinase